jgi:hypothetical protein
MKKIILFLLLVSFFTACKKEKDTGDPLLKYRLSEYTHDLYKYTFEYDSLNRITKSGTFYDGALIYNTRFFYVNSRLDSLTTYNSIYPITYETFRYLDDTLFHATYRYSFDDKITLKNLIQDNQIVKTIFPPCALDDSLFQCHYEVLHWDGNNLAYKYVYSNSGWVYPYYKNSGNTGDFPMTNSIWSAYDDHPNPLKFIYDQVYPDVYESSENNLLRMVVADMQGDTLFRYFSHTYNENGLPVSTTETQAKNDTPLNEDIILVSSTSTYTYEEY